jgi:hypothetical protein
LPCFTLWGRTLKVDASDFSTRNTLICRAQEETRCLLLKKCWFLLLMTGQGR